MTISRPAPRVANPAAIDFGAPSAERDIERGLEEYFVESEAYNRVRSGAKRIVVGNRGIGKSAIFQVLARRERDAGSYVIELSPEDYSYELLSQTMAAEHSGSWAKLGAYAVAWKYLIYVLIMKEVSKRKVHLRKGEAAQIYKYIRDNHANPHASKLSALLSYLKRMEGLKIGKYEASIKARELEKLYKLEEIHHLLPGLREVANHRRVIVPPDHAARPTARFSGRARRGGSTSRPPSASRRTPCSAPTWAQAGPEPASSTAARRGGRSSQFGGERGPDIRIVAGNEPVAEFGGDALELADLRNAHLGGCIDPAADRDLAVDVLGQVGRIEGEHESPAASGRVHPHHETLVTRGPRPPRPAPRPAARPGRAVPAGPPGGRGTGRAAPGR
ncbi:MAG TPA: ATP-binding protein [Streptosporangiaceae bacterium]|nr:ATP-binding protein [Streptosporangiaceae bacterium]